jgi:hypothetical protein
MTGLDLTVVREPSRVAPGSGAGASKDGSSAFVAALAALTGREVTLFEGLVRDASSEGLLIVRPTADFRTIASEMRPEAAAALPARTILVDGRREELLETLEGYGLAGGIDAQRFLRWRTGGDHDSGVGLLGLRSVADTMSSASLFSDPHLQTERYGYILGDRSRGLPGELLDYLDAYARRSDW